MSAAPIPSLRVPQHERGSRVLSRVWATADTSSHAGFTACRKGPRALRLVHPLPAVTAPAVPLRLPQPELAFYRKQTEALLARYMSMSLEAGRVTSLMGRELFPGEVSHCRINIFDDVVHFVHDVGNCLKLLSPGQQYLLRRIALQGYSHGETAALLGICLSTVVRRYGRALDRLTCILIERHVLIPSNPIERMA